MAHFFSEEDKEILNKKGITNRDIKDLNETINRFYKRKTELDLPIDSKMILDIPNLKELMDVSVIYGVKYSKVIRKLIIDYINSKNENEGYLFKGLVRRSMRNEAPDYMNMKGTAFYMVYLTRDVLRMYFLDKLYRIVDIQNIKIKDLEEISLFNRVRIEGKWKPLYYQILKVNDHGRERLYYMYSTESVENSELPKFTELLIDLGVKKTKRRNIEEYKGTNKLAYFLLIGVIILILIRVLS